MRDNKVIKIRRAKVHNLKNISLDIPKNKLIVITGVSGSGKSSLAFDTLYAEGQRRYVESLSAYARQFLGVMQKPEVERIEGISPAISIDQRKVGHNPRSTVGTITEIYDYLRLLFARVGVPHCPKCGKRISQQTIDQITEQVLNLPRGKETIILGPVVRGRKGEYRGVLEEIQRGGFVRVRVDGIVYRAEEALNLNLERYKKHNIEVVVDRLVLKKNMDRIRLVDSLETALKLGKGIVIVSVAGGLDPSALSGGQVQEMKKSKGSTDTDLVFSEHFACEKCRVSLPELEPRLFSFNSPYGACPVCQGLGKTLAVDPNRVLPNKDLSIAEGAVVPWARASHKIGRQGYFWRLLKRLSDRHNFSLDKPVRSLPKKAIDIILYGDKETPGVSTWLEKRYHETESESARQEVEKYMVEKVCKACKGKRLKAEVLAVKVSDKSIAQAVKMPVEEARKFFKGLLKEKRFRDNSELSKIAQPIVKEIVNRMQFLIDVGLDYLTLDRKASTLSGGEEERIRLATQIGSKLTGVLYILDEPSIGLHPKDQDRLIKTLKKLRDLGNTVLVVEHDPQTIMAADWIIDIGPAAGKHGGKLMFEGTPAQLLKSKTLTGEYLSGRKQVLLEKPSENESTNSLVIKQAAEHNLKNIDVRVPLKKFVCITGVSGSGKSSLMNDILARALMRKFYHAKEEPGKHKEILGTERLNKVVLIDQSPIGRTPRSNPATYTGTFTYIRKLFSKTKEAKLRGYRPGRFSFNVKGGRCESCQGQGENKIEMYFLPDIYVRCAECKGMRFNKETLAVEYKGRNIAQILDMTVEDALEFFKNVPGLSRKLKTLKGVGLGYLELGQPATALSGGEAQRIKLAAELSKKATGDTLYILDEPTTGLHPDDIKRLVSVLRKLVDRGNTVLVIEHNLDVIRNSDWIIDLGPEGGKKGGKIVVEGSPEKITKTKRSYTGRYLKKVLKKKKS
jgi:excinuclease ABC subunit A